jgi:hypothetical protein
MTYTRTCPFPDIADRPGGVLPALVPVVFR